jgi:hypothetical protein
MLEYIVRPFQAPNAHGTIIIPSTPTPSTETAILTWGGEATLPEVQYIELGFNTRKGREDFAEKNRDAETVRIYGEDPGDGPSYIDVSRSNKLYLDKTTEELLASDAGQIDYAASGSIYNTPLASKKSKATIKLNNNTTAAS